MFQPTGSPRVVLRLAEDTLLAWRAQPPDMAAAVSAALTEALCGDPAPPGAAAAGRAIANAVSSYAASIPNKSEPPYHDQRHQAESTIVMGWLCARGRRFGLSSSQAIAGVLAMAGHDLHHDGSWPGAGILEARSAQLTTALATAAELDDAQVATIHRVILATDLYRPAPVREADDLLCRLGQEADVFASLTPHLGWRLSEALAREADKAGYRFDPPVATFAGRLVLLRGQRAVTPPGQEFGLTHVIIDQIAAMAAFGHGDPDLGAAVLDGQPQDQARDAYMATFSALVAE